MNAIDFTRSFLTFRIDTERKPPRTVSHPPPFSLNNARIQMECRCRVTEKRTLLAQEFVLGASCKTERVGVDRDIWTEPNADFAPIFSESRFLFLKTYARTGIEVDRYPPGSGSQSDRQSGQIADTFDSLRIDLHWEEAEVLEQPGAVIAATLANQPLVARTILDAPRHTAVLEYPIKTMNANERDGVFQTDTGPVLLPDLTCDFDQMLDNLALAFAAFNCASWIEFLVRVPTPVNDDVSVYHYSKPLHVDAINEVFRIPRSASADI